MKRRTASGRLSSSSVEAPLYRSASTVRSFNSKIAGYNRPGELFDPLTTGETIGTAVGLLALAGYLLGRACFSRLTFVGAALVLAGGASNLIDRIARDGLVTDFVMLRCGPLHTGVFNLADMFVLLGVSLIFLAQWRTPPPIAGGQQP